MTNASAARRRQFYEASRELAKELGQEVTKSDNSYRVPSRSHADVFYTVTRGLDGAFVCNCPASYHRLECWHIKYVREEIMTSTDTSTALVPIKLAPAPALLPSEHEMRMVEKAAMMAVSGAITLPAELNTPQKVAAVMLYGLELGLKPMTAIRHLYIVKGRVSPSAEVMAGLLMRAEPDARITVEELDDDHVVMRLRRPSRQVNHTYEVTWGEIEKAGLAGTDANSKYPRDRMRYHATKRLLRIYAPDIINMLDGPSIEGMAPEPEPADEGAGDELYNEGDEVVSPFWKEQPRPQNQQQPAQRPVQGTQRQAQARSQSQQRQGSQADAMTTFWTEAKRLKFDNDYVLAECQRLFSNREPKDLTPSERSELLGLLQSAKSASNQPAAEHELDPKYDEDGKPVCGVCGQPWDDQTNAHAVAQAALV